MNTSNNKEIWESIYYRKEQLNKYPYDSIVSFVFRNTPRDKKKSDIKILEIGCGAGNNLWFAAREGFKVVGIDASKSAIEFAKKRFKEDGLEGRFIIGDFSQLPFDDEEFDLVIDRTALTYCSFDVSKKVIDQLKRVLKTNGKMFFNPFSDRHGSFVSGKLQEDGMVTDISRGIKECGNTFFYGKRHIYNLFKDGWQIKSIRHLEEIEEINPEYFSFAEWRVIIEKVE